MKAIEINGQIRVFTQLPNSWKNHDNFRMADAELLESEGFFDIVIPDFDSKFYQKELLYFDSENNVFTYTLVPVPQLTLTEAKKEKKEELKRSVSDLFQAVQWYAEMKQMADESIPLAVKQKILFVKSKYEQFKTEIENCTTVEEIDLIQLPLEQVRKLKQEIDDLI